MKKHVAKPRLEYPKGKYYVYTLSYPNGDVFYVGKGHGRRVHDHEREARRENHQCAKCDIIRRVWASGKQITKNFVFTTTSEAEALSKEAEFIRLYDLSLLANVSAGRGGILTQRQRYHSRSNPVEIKAQLKRRRIPRKEQREILEDWHDKKINILLHQRRAARFYNSPKMYQEIDEAILSHQIAIGEKVVEQLSFDDTL